MSTRAKKRPAARALLPTSSRGLHEALPGYCPDCGEGRDCPHAPRCSVGSAMRRVQRVITDGDGLAAVKQLLWALTRQRRAGGDFCLEVFERNARNAGFRAGIRAAASFAGEWDRHITGTRYHFEDLVLGKFNQIAKSKMRRKAK